METILVIALVALAGWHVARSFRRETRPAGGCSHGCPLAGRCGAGHAPAAASCAASGTPRVPPRAAPL